MYLFSTPPAWSEKLSSIGNRRKFILKVMQPGP